MGCTAQIIGAITQLMLSEELKFSNEKLIGLLGTYPTQLTF